MAIVFETSNIRTQDRAWWCRKVLGSGARESVPELLDLRKSNSLWDEGEGVSADLHRAFQRARQDEGVEHRLARIIENWNGQGMAGALDDLTRLALTLDLPEFPLVVIDEIHGLKNEHVQVRCHLKRLLTGRVSRLLGLSATPFQLRQDELLSLLQLRESLSLGTERKKALNEAVDKLDEAMKRSRASGDDFRRRWRNLTSSDSASISAAWNAVNQADEADRASLVKEIRPPRLAHAIEVALKLELCNRELRTHLHPFVIRHQHARGYRNHFVGRHAEINIGAGRPQFDWVPGMEVRGDNELANYLMMRAVALAKDEKGLPGLGAELTGSYRHLTETAAVWKRLANASNPLLREYRGVLQELIGGPDADGAHCKVQATVKRALEFFKQGQKTLVFCVYTKTAETIRDQLKVAIDNYLSESRERVFGEGTSFENFRKRFFNRREPLFSLIQDHPLLGMVDGNRWGIPKSLALTITELRRVAELLVANGESSENEKPDRRLLLAATEHIAVNAWSDSREGSNWLERVLADCPELEEHMADEKWLEAREPLSRSERASRARRSIDPEASDDTSDPLDLENVEEDESGGTGNSMDAGVDGWIRRLQKDALGEVIAPYFRREVVAAPEERLPLLAQHHGELLSKLDLATRVVAGQVFRRVLMAEEFLLRYLADVERENATTWADYLTERYVKQLAGHLESLRDRVHAYLETLLRAQKNKALLDGYHRAAENRNVAQLVKGDTQNRDRYFLGFNTPYRPEILVSTSVGQEGIDLHRECRHVIHHDLCWNPAVIEQRTGRVDRIGSKVERERLGVQDGEGPTLEIAVPYLAATYDERMFEELYRRAQLFEVTLGGEMRVDGRIDPEQVRQDQRRREKQGIGTEDEDLGEEGDATGEVALPAGMIESLRVDLAIWKRGTPHLANGE
jgi:superfamily II DNA or RNA helicase